MAYGLFQHSGKLTNLAPCLLALLMNDLAFVMFACLSCSNKVAVVQLISCIRRRDQKHTRTSVTRIWQRPTLSVAGLASARTTLAKGAAAAAVAAAKPKHSGLLAWIVRKPAARRRVQTAKNSVTVRNTVYYTTIHP